MIAGSPEGVEAAADDVARAAASLVEAGVSVAAHGRAATAQWVGDTSDAARTVLDRLGARTVIGGEDLADAVPALREYAAELRVAQEQYAAGAAAAGAGRVALGDAVAREAAAVRGGVDAAGAAMAAVGARAGIAAAQHEMTAAVARVERANQAAADRVSAVTAALAGMNMDPPAPPAPAPPPPAEEGWSFSDVGHGLLDVAGLVPGLGEPLDGVNAVWYLAEGDKLNAGLSAGGMIPFGGWGATGAKWTLKAADEVGAGARGADGAVRAADEAVAAGRRTADEAAALERAMEGSGAVTGGAASRSGLDDLARGSGVPDAATATAGLGRVPDKAPVRSRTAGQASSSADGARAGSSGGGGGASSTPPARPVSASGDAATSGPTGTAGGSGLSPAERAVAEQHLARAAAAEPRITEAMHRVRDAVPNSRLEGLDYRLKGAESFERKLAGDLLDDAGLSVNAAASQVNDAVRYTVVSDAANYTEAASQTMQRLQAEGFEAVRTPKNTWGSDGYQGVNSTWRDPQTGQTFEVQLHTPESLAAKEVTHQLYEQARVLPKGSAERLALEATQNEVFRAVPRPPGASTM